MSSTEPQAATSTLPEIPEGETYVTHGLITDSSNGGGGYDFAPGHTQRRIDRADGSHKWLTLSTYRGMMNPCMTCKISPPSNQASCYGTDSWILVTLLHNHYVVRLLDEQFRH